MGLIPHRISKTVSARRRQKTLKKIGDSFDAFRSRPWIKRIVILYAIIASVTGEPGFIIHGVRFAYNVVVRAEKGETKPAIEYVQLESMDQGKGGIKIDGMEISLEDKVGQAYLLSTKSASEHANVELTFTPITSALNYYLLVENSYKLIFGDGDRRSVALEKFVGGGKWERVDTQCPDEVVRDKCFLKHEFPINHEVFARLEVDARSRVNGEKQVSLRLTFYDAQGVLFETKNSEQVSWEFFTPADLNGSARYGIGLIDLNQDLHPHVLFGSLRVFERN